MGKMSGPLTIVTLSSPIGPLMIVSSNQVIVELRLWAEDEEKILYDLKAAYPKSKFIFDSNPQNDIAFELNAYFAGKLTEFSLPVHPKLTAFQNDVLNLVSQIPYGQTRTYGQIARELGKPGAARAVGMANRNNPVPILIPCHRVLGADGSLVGYAGKSGVQTKVWLLKHEGVKLKRGIV